MKTVHAGSMAVGAALAAGAGVFMAMGPLDPPGGPVTATEPSLADLEVQIASLASQTDIGNQLISVAPSEGADRLNATLEVSGRVFVERLIVFRGQATVFDGPGGEIDSGGGGRPISGGDIGTARQDLNNGGAGRAGDGTISVELNIVAENGLYLAYKSFSNSAFIQVVYREID